MLLKGCVLLTVCLTVSGMRRKNHCRDDMLTIADGRYPCDMLTDRNHPQGHLGAYSSRLNLCSRHGHSGCCKTCRENGLVMKRRSRNRGVPPMRKNQRHEGNRSCRDRMLRIAGGSYSCLMLIDQHNWKQKTLGAYDQRAALCSKPDHSGCCKTCKRHNSFVSDSHRQKPHAETPKTLPILIVDGVRLDECAEIDPRSSRTGYWGTSDWPVYTSAFEHAPSTTVNFWKKSIQTYHCKDSGLRIAGGTYDCALLIDKNHTNQGHIGAYGVREKLCNLGHQSGCCRTCTMYGLYVSTTKKSSRHFPQAIKVHVVAVGEEVPYSFCPNRWRGSEQITDLCNTVVSDGAVLARAMCYVSSKSDKIKKKESNQKTSHSKENKKDHRRVPTPPSYCRDSGLRIADGSYDCALLIDKHHTDQAVIGAYTYRHKLCSKRMFSGCCHTCQRHVIGRSRRVCKDEYVVVLKNKSTYACRELLQRKSDIYSDRFELCEDTVNTRCCKACKKVSKTKSINESTRNVNLVNKPSGTNSVTNEGTTLVTTNTEARVSDTHKHEKKTHVKVSEAHKAYKLMMDIIKRFNQFKAFSKKHLTSLTNELESVRKGQS